MIIEHTIEKKAREFIRFRRKRFIILLADLIWMHHRNLISKNVYNKKRNVRAL